MIKEVSDDHAIAKYNSNVKVRNEELKDAIRISFNRVYSLKPNSYRFR